MAVVQANMRVVREYVTYKDVIERRSEHTLRRTRGTLDRFVLWLGDTRIENVSAKKAQAWVAANRHLDAGTMRVYHSTVQNFYAWAQVEGKVRTNPLARIPKPREPRRRPKGLDEDEVIALFFGAADLRERTLLVLMLQQGLRCAEAAALQVGDLDFRDSIMRVVGKGDKERHIPITDETKRILRRYLDGRKTGPVLRNNRDAGKGLDPKTVGWLVRDIARRGGATAHAHQLRHTCAHDMLRAGAHVKDVQAILGHASLATTQRYLPWSYGDLHEAMAGRSYGDLHLRVDPACTNG